MLSVLLAVSSLIHRQPREGFDSSVIMPFPGVLWLWHFLYSVSLHPVSSLHIYTFVVSRAFMAGAASQVGDADSSGYLVSPLVCRGTWMSTVVLYCWCNSHSASVVLYFTFLSHLFPLPCGAGCSVPREGLDWSVIMSFPGVLWLWHFLYSVSLHPVSSLHIYTSVVSRAFMVGVANQAGVADSSQAPGLTSGLQGPWMSTVVLYCWCHRNSASLVPFAVWSW